MCPRGHDITGLILSMDPDETVRKTRSDRRLVRAEDVKFHKH